jgi:hypothetical protein
MSAELKMLDVEFFFKSNPDKAIEYSVICVSKEAMYEVLDKGFKQGYLCLLIHALGPRYTVFINTKELEMVHIRA